MVGWSSRNRRSRCCSCVNQKCQCGCHVKLTKIQKAHRRIDTLKEMLWLNLILGLCVGMLAGDFLERHFRPDPMADKECSVHECKLVPTVTSTGAIVGEHQYCDCTEWKLKK